MFVCFLEIVPSYHCHVLCNSCFILKPVYSIVSTLSITFCVYDFFHLCLIVSPALHCCHLCYHAPVSVAVSQFSVYILQSALRRAVTS